MQSENKSLINTIIHLSSLSGYIFPFGNFILPCIIWSAKKNNSESINTNGKNILNFQLSYFIYEIILGSIAVFLILKDIFRNNVEINIDGPSDLFFNFDSNFSSGIYMAMVLVLVIIMIEIFKIIFTIYAAVKSSSGETYKYPLSIRFF